MKLGRKVVLTIFIILAVIGGCLALGNLALVIIGKSITPLAWVFGAILCGFSIWGITKIRRNKE